MILWTLLLKLVYLFFFLKRYLSKFWSKWWRATKVHTETLLPHFLNELFGAFKLTKILNQVVNVCRKRISFEWAMNRKDWIKISPSYSEKKNTLMSHCVPVSPISINSNYYSMTLHIVSANHKLVFYNLKCQL